MTSRTSASFRRQFDQLPNEVRRQARLAFRLFKQNPSHPGLNFKKLPPHADLWSARINRDYRVIGRWRGETILWFFIGSHADYEALIRRS